MTVTHEAKLLSAKKRVTITDPEPLPSAKLFKSISDGIWEQRPKKHKLAVFGVLSAVPAGEALKMANDAAAEIDEKLVLANGQRELDLGGMRGERVVVPATKLATPKSASVSTFYWDDRQDGRGVNVGEDEYDYATFTDGHRDYARELNVNFLFQDNDSTLSISYVMQRYQYWQGAPTSIYAHVWNSAFAETGYEGNALHSAEMTTEQELGMLRAIATIGGISLASLG